MGLPAHRRNSVFKTHVDHIRAAWAWDVTSRAGTLPNAGGEMVAHEFDFSKTAFVYNENGVKIVSFPAIHIRDGSVSFRLEWSGLSFVFGGDSAPNKWFLKEAKSADVVIHEAFFTAGQWMKIAGFPYKQAYWVTNVIHTPPEGFGKIMSAVEPRMAVAYHYWNHRDIEFEVYDGIRKTYSGPLVMADDLTVINATRDHIEVREVSYDHEAWAQGTSAEWDTAPRSDPATGLMSDWLKEGICQGDGLTAKGVRGGSWPLLDPRGSLLRNDQQCSPVAGAQLADLAMGVAQQHFDLGIRTISELQPERPGVCVVRASRLPETTEDEPHPGPPLSPADTGEDRALASHDEERGEAGEQLLPVGARGRAS